jgi:hypothetical protein
MVSPLKPVATGLTGSRKNQLKIIANSNFEFVDTKNQLSIGFYWLLINWYYKW